jgi:hypothetical protein
MFWRSDPRKAGGAKSLSDDNWPRNGAILTGNAFEHGGEKVSKIKVNNQTLVFFLSFLLLLLLFHFAVVGS